MHSFVDTNVRVYADDGGDRTKQSVATGLIEAHLRVGSRVISTQVLREFVNTALRKLMLPVDLIRARLALYRRFEVVPSSADLVTAALDIHVLHRLSYWDALIVQAARQSGCVQLLTEDMNTGAVVAGVRLVNPFA